MTPLKPSDLSEALHLCFQAGRSPMVHGDPGIGKSQVAMQVADAMFSAAYGHTVNEHTGVVSNLAGTTRLRPWFIEIRASQWDAVDLRGLPAVDKKTGKTLFMVPDTLPTDERGGIIFLDEINRGTEMVQNALFQLLDQGRIGDYYLPKGWKCCAAVNDKDTGARKMSSALQARFIHIDAVTDLEDVITLANKRDWAPEVVAFLRFKPGLLHVYEPKLRVSPNPRAWDFVSDLTKQKASKSMLRALVSGTVGDAAAIEYCAFIELYSTLPSIESILSDPDNANVPTQPATLYAVAAALARRVTTLNLGNVLRYLARLPQEYNVVSVVDAVRRQPALQSTGHFVNWCHAHKEVVFG